MSDFPNENLLKQRQQLREIAQGFRQAQILLSCVELGVFEALEARPATASEMAHTIGADSRGTELLLNAAAALDLVKKSEERFSNNLLVAACVLPDATGNILTASRVLPALGASG